MEQEAAGIWREMPDVGRSVYISEELGRCEAVGLSYMGSFVYRCEKLVNRKRRRLRDRIKKDFRRANDYSSDPKWYLQRVRFPGEKHTRVIVLASPSAIAGMERLLDKGYAGSDSAQGQ